MMTTAHNNKIKLYQFTDFDMDKFVNLYLNDINPHEELDENTISCYNPSKYVLTQPKRGVRDRSKIEWKCMFLQDVIIRRAFHKEDSRTFSLNTQILKSVIGNEYKPMLNVFIKMGYIQYGDGQGGAEKRLYYSIGKYSTIYTMNDVEVHETDPIQNFTIIKYRKKTAQAIDSLLESKVRARMEDKYGKKFVAQYLKSLQCFHITDRVGFAQKVSQLIHENPKAKPYYQYVKQSLDEPVKRITRIDSSGRIYHCLTNLKRDLKPYLNIDFAIDCKNSHPLMLTNFIYSYHKIPTSIRKGISYLIKSSSSSQLSSLPSIISHNVEQYRSNKLGNNHIDNSVLSKDEIVYIHKTSNGLFWDEINAAHPDMERSAIKEALFQAVFYTKEKDLCKWNGFAKDFKKSYPHVNGLIASWKDDANIKAIKQYMDEHNLSYDDWRCSLSIAMMAFEAEVFIEILKRLYAHGWKAVHIHDCIVIPKDGSTKHPTQQQVVEIMKEVFGEYGLCPTFDCSRY